MLFGVFLYLKQYVIDRNNVNFDELKTHLTFYCINQIRIKL
jgi:hypothetical protein